MGYTALYRQYRPLGFDQVVGQEHITTTLKNQLIGDRVAHAYLFAGTRGTGKTSTARIFARAVNCLDTQKGNPCNKCEICNLALSGKLMDIIEIDAASNRGVDEIRDLREKVKYPPAEARYRVYIVDEVHMLTAEAFNALLKTLEEPPSHVIFILATTEPHKLPATVLSRCQRFDFKRISVSEITELLQRVVKQADIIIDRGALEVIAVSADGAARDALSLLDKCSTLQQGRLTLDRVVSVLGMANEKLLFGLSAALACRDAAGCITLLNRAIKDGRDTGQLFKDIIYHLRDILIAGVSPSGLSDMSKEKAEHLLMVADKLEVNTLIRAIDVLSEAQAKAKWSAHPGILLEVALVKLCEPSMDSSIEGLIDRISRIEDIVLKGKAPKAASGKDKAPAEDVPEPAGADSPEEVQGDCTVKPAARGKSRPHEENKSKPDKQSGATAVESRNTQEDIDLEQITAAWDKVLKHLEKSKKGLFTLLKNSRPTEAKGAALVIGCQALHGIYYDIVNSKENKEALREAIYTVTGSGCEVVVESVDNEQSSLQADMEQECGLYEEAVEIFGSHLVEALEDKDD